MIYVNKITTEWKISLNLYNYIYGEYPKEKSSESYFYFKYAENGFDKYSIEESAIELFFCKIKKMILLSNEVFSIKIKPFIISKNDKAFGCLVNNYYEDGYFMGISLNSFYKNEYILEEVFLHELTHLLLFRLGENKNSFLIKMAKDGADLKEFEEVFCNLMSSEKLKKQNSGYYKNASTLFDSERKDGITWNDFSIQIKNI